MQSKDEEKFSNREITRMFSEVQDSLGRIETQTSKTNGRVSKLERWQTGIVMCIGLIAFVLTISISIVAILYK